ncbi:hypothetical protein GF402_08460 [Candidatus Fermentibacteria bacterium]|nr:hypothetical protein [Candidatus Fermentibacteria bacterium]
MSQSMVLLAYSFPPLTSGGTPVVVNMVRYLPRSGWVPAVLTAEVPTGMPLDHSLKASVPEEIIVRRVPQGRLLNAIRKGRAGSTPPTTTSRGRGHRSVLSLLAHSFVLVPDRLITWMPRVVPAGIALARRTNAAAIVSFGPHHSLHLHAMIIARRTGAPFVPYFGDLWLEDSCVEWPCALNRRIEAFLEKLVVGRATGIVVTTEGAAEYFRNTYPARCPPMAVVQNSYDPARVRRITSPPPPRDHMLVTFTGNFFGMQSPEIILRGFRRFLDQRPEARARLRLVGNLEQQYRHLPRDLGMGGSVEVIKTVPYAEVPRIQAESDILLTFLVPRPGSERKNSSKLAEYLRIGRPILAIAPEGDMVRNVRELRAGYVSAPNPVDVAKALSKVYEDWKNSQLRGPADPAETARRFDAENVMRGFAAFLSRITGRKP